MNWWSRDCLRNMFYDRKMFILRKSIRFFITFGLSGLFLLSLFMAFIAYPPIWNQKACQARKFRQRVVIVK